MFVTKKARLKETRTRRIRRWNLIPLKNGLFGIASESTSSSAFLQRVIASLHGEFAMTDLGSLNLFLGIFAQRSSTGLFLSQSTYAEEILERAHMQKCNPCRTLVDTESKLGADGDSGSGPTLYRSLAVALQCLTFTCPDISSSLQQVFLYMHDPRELHLAVLKRILHYLRVTRGSTSGYYVFLGDNLLSWSAKRQVTLSRSSAEAEYRGVANVVVETGWVCNLLRELHAPLFTATLIYCDNVSVVYMSTNPVQHQYTKHIEIDIHFVRDFVTSRQVRVLHVPSRFQYEGVFTNGLPNSHQNHVLVFHSFQQILKQRRYLDHKDFMDYNLYPKIK
ncbi:ribonuclease H-like domain-containing protein [Tanacetum coccineum]